MDQTSMLKVIFQNKGKTLDNSNLSYKQLIQKLMRGFKLNPNNYYHLCYVDADKDFITIQTQEDYQIFLNSAVKRKLYIEQINSPQQNFVLIVKNSIKQVQRPNFHKIFQEKRQNFMRKLQHFEAQITANLKKQLNTNIQQIFDKGKTIHANKYCSKCPKKRFIEGARFQCVICNFNLCEKCQQDDDHIHPLIKIRDQSQAIAQKMNVLFVEDVYLDRFAEKRRQQRKKKDKQSIN